MAATMTGSFTQGGVDFCLNLEIKNKKTETEDLKTDYQGGGDPSTNLEEEVERISRNYKLRV